MAQAISGIKEGRFVGLAKGRHDDAPWAGFDDTSKVESGEFTKRPL